MSYNICSKRANLEVELGRLLDMMRDEKGIKDNCKAFGLRNWVVCDAIY